jgi:Flp pilus assembly protein TadD
MRFAETLMRTSLLAMLCAGATGCASVNDAWSGLGSSNAAPAPAATTPTRAAQTPVPTPASAPVAAAAPAPVEVLTPVDAAAQRAYDAARRALAAGRNDEAERGMRALVKSNPELGGPHANLGLMLGRSGRFAEAVTELELAVKASPNQPVFHNQLGVAYRQQGQFLKARAAYERALDLDANYAAACLNLGILNDLYLRDAKRALELYDRYLVITGGKDAAVSKWVADLKNRKPEPSLATKKEQS